MTTSDNGSDVPPPDGPLPGTVALDDAAGVAVERETPPVEPLDLIEPPDLTATTPDAESFEDSAVAAPGGTALFTAGPAASPRTLMNIFGASVRDHRDEVALDDGAKQLTYRALADEVENLRVRLALAGVRRGDRVGVRVPSGTNDLYIAILSVLAVGAAYVPVDAEDPDERAELVFGEAGVRAVIGAGHDLTAWGPDGKEEGGA
ncbi:AMP-binding protein, partial [Streptomyces sp. NPDC059916]